MSALVTNFFGGPGSGKSTMAARIFSELKNQDINAELVTEFAKDLTWQESFNVLDNQLYVFAKQFHRLWRLKDKVDIIVTDSPLLNSLVYGDTSKTFKKLVQEEFEKFNNLNIFLSRTKKYNPKGRSQTEEEAKAIDAQILSKLAGPAGKWLLIPGNIDSTDKILKLVLDAHRLNTQGPIPQAH